MPNLPIFKSIIMRKVILYISSSLDGFIAGPNNDLSFLDKMHLEGEDYGYTSFVNSIDTVLVGRKTYQWVIDQGYEYPHGNKMTYVYDGDLKTLVAKLKTEKGRNIYCDGGAKIVNMMLQAGLIDEIILSVIPVLLGAGTSLFSTTYPKKALKLLKSQSYSSGLTQLHYRLAK
jgi:dihydrofolate reductase